MKDIGVSLLHWGFNLLRKPSITWIPNGAHVIHTKAIQYFLPKPYFISNSCKIHATAHRRDQTSVKIE